MSAHWSGDFANHFDKIPPASAMSNNETEMMNNSKRILTSGKTEDAVDKLRHLCLARGATGIMGLGRCLRRIDGNGEKQLNLNEFTKGLKDSGFEVTNEEAREIFLKFNTDDSEHINMTEFIVGVRPHMSESRISIVNDAFRKLDRANDGRITKKNLKAIYSVKSHPKYISGEESEEALFEQFLANFEEGGEVDEKFCHFALHWKYLSRDVLFPGYVTKEEFDNYYAAVSASVESDGYFNLMIRQAYNL